MSFVIGVPVLAFIWSRIDGELSFLGACIMLAIVMALVEVIA